MTDLVHLNTDAESLNSAYRRSLVRHVTKPETPTRPSRFPTHVSLAFRVAVSATMLAILFVRIPKEDLGELWPTWNLSYLFWFSSALVVTAIAFLLSVIRWHHVTRGLGLDISIKRLTTHYLAGQFVGNFLPTTIGGDVLRVSRVGNETSDRPAAFASVVIERLTGWVVLPVLTLGALVVNRGLLEQGPARFALSLATIILVLLTAIVYLAEHPRVGGKVIGDSAIREALGAVHLELGTLRRRPRAAFQLLGVSVAYQAMLVLATGLAGAAIGIRPGPTAWLAFAPMVFIIQMLPTIGGLGVRETALVLFLGSYGVSDVEAVKLGLMLYLLNLVVSLTGAPSFAMGPRPAHVAEHGAVM